MPKKMLIDAAHPEETRVVVLDGNKVDDFDFEVQNRKQLRGNIYLAKITRVEPSLQAAFVEYGGNRHGFLAFSEIHPDYYQIPVADREALKAEVEAAQSGEDPELGADGEAPESEDEDDQAALDERRRRILTRRYRIQEVIRRRQIMLVQVVKEERGQKGAALTTYLSLAGRYCVLMPNTGRGGGISRKITNATDRKRLKKVAADLDVPGGMGLIIRTAGAKRTKTEIKRDYEYLIRAWENIRDNTMRSIAPSLIYEESSLVKRAIRDLYDKDVEDIHVEGDAAYREAKDFVRMLMPSHAKKVAHWKGPTPIFTAHGVERQLESIHSPIVQLKSGGYIVINQTEALVAIDVNSGRATRERNIEQTALKTNLEAADEAARQMRLRDLAGLVVLDFIDMEEAKNDRQVEKRMKDCLRFDRARVQMGKISPFGLLELSRQRRRTGVLEGSTHICPACAGSGRVRSVQSSALRLMRALDEFCERRSGEAVEARVPTEVALYVLNEKRQEIAALEDARKVRVRIVAYPGLIAPDFEIVPVGQRIDEETGELIEAAPPQRFERPERYEHRERPERDRSERDRSERDRSERERPPERAERSERGERDYDRGGRGRGRPAPQVVADAADMDESEVEEVEDIEAEDAGNGGSEEANRRRRRRGRRGGRRQREDGVSETTAQPRRGPQATDDGVDEEDEQDVNGAERSSRRRRRRRGRGRGAPADAGEALDYYMTEPLLRTPSVPASDLGNETQLETAAETDDTDAPSATQPAERTPRPRRDRRGRGPRTQEQAAPPLSEAPEEDTDAQSPEVVIPAIVPLTTPQPIIIAAAPPIASDFMDDAAPAPVLAAVAEPVAEYEPDLQSREKFFARLSRWGKKTSA